MMIVCLPHFFPVDSITQNPPSNDLAVFDCGSLKYDKDAAIKYRDASLQYFKFFLCGEGSPPDLSEFDVELRNGLHCWDEVGAHICEVNSKG